MSELVWTAPPGAWSRDFRLGEWLGAPPSPLFATWLLPGIEAGLAGVFARLFGLVAPPPHHVLVHGWYFGSLNFLPTSPFAMARVLFATLLPRFVVRPRRTAMALPPLAHLGIDWHTRDWRERILPAYRAAVAGARARVDTVSPAELVALVDDLAVRAGEYFASMTFVAGYAWKAELPLAEWIQRCVPGEPYAPLLVGLGEGQVPAHAVTSLDWMQPTLGELDGERPAASAARARRVRIAAEARFRARLAARPREQRRFEALLERAQRAAVVREAQVAEFTAPWPVLRRAVLRLGGALAAAGAIERADDVFMLERDELDRANGSHAASVGARRRLWQEQSRLSPPLVLGERPPLVRALTDRVRRLHPRGAERALVIGTGASPGRITGVARVVRDHAELARLGAGEILVAPATTPAWMSLLGSAAAVVTDTGSLLAHASLVARELGVPAVVGTGDATARIVDGQRVTVDGDNGTVTLDASPGGHVVQVPPSRHGPTSHH